MWYNQYLTERDLVVYLPKRLRESGQPPYAPGWFGLMSCGLWNGRYAPYRFSYGFPWYNWPAWTCRNGWNGWCHHRGYLADYPYNNDRWLTGYPALF